MSLIVVSIIVLFIVVAAVFAVLSRRARERRELALHSITPEDLHLVIASGQKALVFDVRQPLDLLAYSEIIPGAVRIAPKEVLANPGLLPQEEDAIVYCTCPDDKTARSILKRAKELNFTRIKLLTGGLGAWKAKGYPVEPYKTSFHLDTAI